MDGRPSPVVPLLFSDVERSTRLWEEDRHTASRLMAEHDRMLRKSIGSDT
jgi:class 3 adenylate cyclase